MADKLWILVANASRARLFSADAAGDDWKLIDEFFHEESRAHAGDLTEQRDNPNAGSLHKPQPENEPQARKQVEFGRFAKELCQRLDRGVDSHAFEQLVIAAPPNFLGTLRNQLSTRVQSRVVMDLNSDFTNVPERDLHGRIPLS